MNRGSLFLLYAASAVAASGRELDGAGPRGTNRERRRRQEEEEAAIVSGKTLAAAEKEEEAGPVRASGGCGMENEQIVRFFCLCALLSVFVGAEKARMEIGSPFATV